MKRLIEGIVDLVFPPEEGEEPIAFRSKLVVFVLLVLVVLFALVMSR